jgi:hypothetical protein
VLEPVVLGDDHVDELAPAGDQLDQGHAAVFDFWGLRRPHGPGKVRDNPGVDPIRLGQPAARSGEVPNAAWIDDRHRCSGPLQRAHDLQFVTAGRFQNRQRGAGKLRRQRRAPRRQLAWRTTSPPPSNATSRCALDTSMPTKVPSSTIPSPSLHAGSRPRQPFEPIKRRDAC